MAPDDFQTAWQSQTIQTNVTINTDELLQEVKQSQESFQFMIFARDLREVGVAALMIPLWIYWGISDELPWTWYLTIPACLWIIGFMLIDRRRHPRQPNKPGETLLQCVKDSLDQVEHQIWLLRNIFWWYLLPFTISLMAFFTQVCWQASATSRAAGASGWLEFAGGLSIFSIVLLVIYSWVYYVNQRTVRVQLEPQRQELLTLQTSLSHETEGEISDEIDIPVTVSPFAENGFIRGTSPHITPPRSAVSVAVILGALLVVVVIFAAVVEFIVSSFSEKSTALKSDNPADVQDSSVAHVSLSDDSLTGLITQQRDKNKLVGLAAMVMVDGKIVDSAVAGERKIRSGVPIQIGDRWHVGGITCSVTATMIAQLVESGQLKWTDTVGDMFPEDEVHEYWKPITLTQLLTNTSGAPMIFPLDVRRQNPAFGEDCATARIQAVQDVIAEKPTALTSNFVSAVGPTIACAMAEKVTGDVWSNLVTEIVFRPLHLNGSGFGPPKSSDTMLQQPRGHRTLPGKHAFKYAFSDTADNSSIMGPALSAHMTLHDLCTYATEHLLGYFREGQLLSTETYQVLHTPETNQYAYGWVRRKPDTKMPVTVYWHNGSNTMWHSFVAFIPERNMVVAVTSNDGDLKNGTVAWEILTACITRNQLQAEKPEGKDLPR